MHVPSQPIDQDPISKMLWFIAKQLEQLNGIGGILSNNIGNLVPPPIPPTSLDIYFISTADPIVDVGPDVSDWNALFDLPNNGTPFTSVDIDMTNMIVHLFGGANIDLKTNIFGSFLADVLTIIDLSEALISTQVNALANNSSLTDILLYREIVILDGFATGCNALINVYLPLVSDIGASAFANCSSIETINIPMCSNLGGSVGNNNVFNGITGQNIQLHVSAYLMVNNGGSPDGDIQYLMANNSVVII